MDQKRAMLYPSIDRDAVPAEQRLSASDSIGLPREAPPSYDAAMAVETASGASTVGGTNVRSWEPSAPANNEAVIVESSPALEPHTSTVPGSSSATITPIPRLGPKPSKVTCPACDANKTTRMVFTPNSRTHLCALLLGIVGWCCCACFVPYCMNSCRTGNHYCRKCNTFLGTYDPPERRNFFH